MALAPEEIMEKTNDNPPMCGCCRRRLTRIILPHTSFNETGNYLFHCMVTGRITPIRDIDWVIKQGRQEVSSG